MGPHLGNPTHRPTRPIASLQNQLPNPCLKICGRVGIVFYRLVTCYLALNTGWTQRRQGLEGSSLGCGVYSFPQVDQRVQGLQTMYTGAWLQRNRLIPHHEELRHCGLRRAHQLASCSSIVDVSFMSVCWVFLFCFFVAMFFVFC